ncbi:hypothetical protein HMPREF9103_00111 [Lentilactobacillus parafarraginis F0439]|uniref:Uncharacterized protein n=1 Tax=Lentilactobacillus parafarraginis F0439 TaxID=797515 RepID=G9ZK63_9LACO|nr:hypothetical protein HMPREF9103_00111 [Lentilactobacillus parafarraginis F0439]
MNYSAMNDRVVHLLIKQRHDKTKSKSPYVNKKVTVNQKFNYHDQNK